MDKDLMQKTENIFFGVINRYNQDPEPQVLPLTSPANKIITDAFRIAMEYLAKELRKKGKDVSKD